MSEDPPIKLGYLDGSEDEPAPTPKAEPPEEPVLELAAPARPPAPARPVVLPARREAPPPRPPAVSVGTFASPVVALLLSLVLSILPARWRNRFADRGLPLVAGTILTGAVEVFLIVLLARAIIVNMTHETVMASMNAIGEQGADQATMFGMGAAIDLSFLVSPAGIFCLLIGIEGMVRMAGAAVTHDPVGTIPLWLVERGIAAARSGAARWQMGPPIADTVVTDDPSCAIRIDSCRDRGWDYQTILHIDGAYYRVTSSERLQGRPPRPWRYRLDLLPEREPIKRPREYRRS